MKRLIPLLLSLLGVSGCAGWGYYPPGYSYYGLGRPGYGYFGPGYYPPYASYTAYCAYCYRGRSFNPNLEDYYKSQWLRRNVSDKQYRNYMRRQYPNDYYKSQWARKNISGRQYRNYMSRKYR